MQKIKNKRLNQHHYTHLKLVFKSCNDATNEVR